MKWDAGLADSLVAQMWENPESLFAQGHVLQEKPRCSVVRIDLPAGSFVLKSHNFGGPVRTLKKALRQSPAKKCWIAGRGLSAAGIPTPIPRAYLKIRGLTNVRSYLLTDYIPGATLYRFMRLERPTAATVHNIAQQVAAIWQQLHELQICHSDLKAENLIIDASGRLWLIDLEKTRRHRLRNQLYSRQALDAQRLLHPRNWRAAPAAAEIFRQYILRTAGAAELVHYLARKTHPLTRPAPAANDPAQLVTALIPSYNNAQVIGECLESVRDMADEILVVDAGSTDRTLDIVNSISGCRLIQQSNLHGADLLNWAQQQAAHPWILTVKPNERVSAKLAKEVQDVLATGPNQDAFRISLRDEAEKRRQRTGVPGNYSALRLHRRAVGQHALRDGRLELELQSINSTDVHSKLLSEKCSSIGQLVYELTCVAIHSSSPGQQSDLQHTPLARTAIERRAA